MSKKNKEVFDDCNHCGQETPITEETAYIVNIRRCFGNFVLNTCIHCNRDTRLFVDEDTQQQFEDMGLGVADTDQIPDPDFVKSYLEVNNIPLPEEHELTPRQDERITNLGKFLQSIDLNLSDFER